MSGPSSIAVGALATTSLATIEAATGINIPMFVWGAVGGLWAFWYLAPMTLRQRVLSLMIAAVVASVAAKPVSMVLISAVTHFLPWWPAAVDHRLAGVPIALVLGLLCHTVLGRKLIDMVGRAADGVQK